MIEYIVLFFAFISSSSSCYNACFIQKPWFDDYNRRNQPSEYKPEVKDL